MTPDNVDRSKVIDFLASYLNEDKTDSLLKTFSLDDIEKKDSSFISLCYAIACHIIKLVKFEEDKVRDEIREDYLLALKNPNAIYGVKFNPDDAILISQQKNRCPLTGRLLTIQNGEVAVYNIVKIFPEGLLPYQEIKFNKIKSKPSDLNSAKNKIALVHEEAMKYLNNPTIDVYQKLVNAKKEYQTKSALDESINEENFTKKIISILDYLMSDKYHERTKLDYVPKNVNDKIDPRIYPLLNDRVGEIVSSNYWFINVYFAENEGKLTNKSTEFGMYIKKKSDELLKDNVPKNKIFDALVEMINDSLPKEYQNTLACEIIISYFVQHCEALGGEICDEISE